MKIEKAGTGILALLLSFNAMAYQSSTDACYDGVWEQLSPTSIGSTRQGMDLRVFTAEYGQGLVSGRWYSYKGNYSREWTEFEGLTYKYPDLQHKFAAGVLMQYQRITQYGQAEETEGYAVGTMDIFPSSLYPGQLRVKWHKDIGIDNTPCEGICDGEFYISRLTPKPEGCK